MTSAKYARLSRADRQVVLEILRETKKGLPDYFAEDLPVSPCKRGNLERAMEKASGRDLKTLFDEAVYH